MIVEEVEMVTGDLFLQFLIGQINLKSYPTGEKLLYHNADQNILYHTQIGVASVILQTAQAMLETEASLILEHQHTKAS